MNKIHRVFFHELGHFVARELNENYFDGTGSVEIKIYPCPQDASEYCGHLTPIRPEGISENDKTPVPIDRLAEHLTCNIYGCIFQSYYLNIDVRTCTDINGEDDIKDWIGSLSANKLSFLNKEIFQLSTQYLELLKSQKLLDKFIKVLPEDYLIETEYRHYVVNLHKLRDDTSQIIEEHHEYYKKFVEGHQEIIDNNLNNK